MAATPGLKGMALPTSGSMYISPSVSNISPIRRREFLAHERFHSGPQQAWYRSIPGGKAVEFAVRNSEGLARAVGEYRSLRAARNTPRGIMPGASMVGRLRAAGKSYMEYRNAAPAYWKKLNPFRKPRKAGTKFSPEFRTKIQNAAARVPFRKPSARVPFRKPSARVPSVVDADFQLE